MRKYVVTDTFFRLLEYSSNGTNIPSIVEVMREYVVFTTVLRAFRIFFKWNQYIAILIQAFGKHLQVEAI